MASCVTKYRVVHQLNRLESFEFQAGASQHRVVQVLQGAKHRITKLAF